MKLLIDECLSPILATRARQLGHPESSHVLWIGKAGTKDWDLLPVILDGDWILVTNNSADFRGPANAPGSRGQYGKVALHAGLTCLNGPVGMDRAMQCELLESALEALADNDDLVNQVLEATMEATSIRITRYPLPP